MSCLVFGAYSSFWTNLAFLLGTPHYRLGAGVAGGFGLLGATGAFAASFTGRLADRKGARMVVAAGVALEGSAYLLLWATGYHLAGLIVGVIVLNIGQQAMQIGNQTRIFSRWRGAQPVQYDLHDHFFPGRRGWFGDLHRGLGALAVEWGVHHGTADAGNGGDFPRVRRAQRKAAAQFTGLMAANRAGGTGGGVRGAWS